MSESHIELRETHMIGSQTRERIVSSSICKALSLYGIHLTGLSSALPGFRFVRLRPGMSQVFVCMSGWGYVWVNGNWERCASGMAYITPPGVLHAYYAVQEVPWETCWVIYGQGEHNYIANATKSPLLLQIEPHPLAQAIEGLYRESIGQGEQIIMHSWAQLLQSYAHRIVRETGNASRLQRVWDAVNADIAYPWNSKTLAERAGISTEHLRRLCQQHLGSSPMKQVTSLRMRHAAMLLAHDAYSIEEVAQRVGYENPFAFSTAFKRTMSIAPSAYRNALQK